MVERLLQVGPVELLITDAGILARHDVRLKVELRRSERNNDIRFNFKKKKKLNSRLGLHFYMLFGHFYLTY